MQSFATPAPRSLSDTLDLTDQALSRPPPVDAAIPLDGFEWDPSSGHFVDRAAGYVFDPANSVFRQTETQHEYVFDKDARLFRPRQPEGTLRQLVPSLKLDALTPAKLKHELSNTAESAARELASTAESFTSFVGQLSRRAVELTAELTPGRSSPAAAPEAAAAPSPPPTNGASRRSLPSEQNGEPMPPELLTPAMPMAALSRGLDSAGASSTGGCSSSMGSCSRDASGGREWSSGGGSCGGGVAGDGDGDGDGDGGGGGGAAANAASGRGGVAAEVLALKLPSLSSSSSSVSPGAASAASGSIPSSDPRVAVLRSLRARIEAPDTAPPRAATDRPSAAAGAMADWALEASERLQMQEAVRLLRAKHDAELQAPRSPRGTGRMGERGGRASGVG